jgi:diacylglycerol kinase family enzyme
MSADGVGRTPPSPPRRPVLIVNPRSGGGKVTRYDLVGECQARGLEAVVFELGDDLSQLARAAVAGGADVIGMAGGDGSQAAVAAVAAEHDVAYVCVPAGTRNHFAFDLGVDRNDIVGALDAFRQGEERRVDLGRANGRVFVNNVALGAYGAVIESPDYRGHKMRTVIQMLPGLIGPKAEPFDLAFDGPDQQAHGQAVLLLVANNPYEIHPRPRAGTRGSLDAGVLGLIAVTGPPPHHLAEWTATTFRVDSAATVELGVDGESVRMEPPIVFETVPGALRVRTSVRAPTVSSSRRREIRSPSPRSPVG